MKDRGNKFIRRLIFKLFKNIYLTSGEFSVVGEGSISFEVRCNNPKKIFVCFADQEPTPIPCVPIIPDELQVVFEPMRGPLSRIHISWAVNDVRTIAWCVRN